ncbi:MAG: hypothetical protein ACK5LP_10750, partial [Campylobacteraceae bacterium]
MNGTSFIVDGNGSSYAGNFSLNSGTLIVGTSNDSASSSIFGGDVNTASNTIVTGYGNISGNLTLNNNAALLLLSDNANDNLYVNSLTLNDGSIINTNYTLTSLSNNSLPLMNVNTLNVSGDVSLLLNTNITNLDTNINNVNSTNLYDYGNSSSLVQYQVINASMVGIGANTQVTLKDLDGNTYSNTDALVYYDLTDNVGRVSFDILSTVQTNGIYVGYGLTEIEAFSGKTVTLNSTNASGNILNAKLTGDGSFTFTGNQST